MLTDAQHPHNLFLSIWCGLGIIGLLLFISIQTLFFKRLITYYIKFRKSNNNNIKFLSTFLLTLITTMIGLLIQGMFDNIWYNNSIFLLFFIILGLGIAITFILERKEIYEKNI